MRTVVGGQTIYLRVLFKDDLGDPATPATPELYIYPPDTIEFIPANAYAGPFTPDSLGEGVYEYAFVTPSVGPEGTWYDQWSGTLNGQVLTTEMPFSIVTEGQISVLEISQLANNQVVTVTIPTSLKATDGTSLAEVYTFDFMTKISPAYTSIRKLLLSAGSFLGGLDDDILQTAILEASLSANVIQFSDTIVNNGLFAHARREYTTCLAAHMLVMNLLRSPLKSKTLDNLSVSYDTNGLRDALKSFEECLQKWGDQISTGGEGAGNPKMVIKGRQDPDRIPVGRGWIENNRGGKPIGNAYVRPFGMRRWFKSGF